MMSGIQISSSRDTSIVAPPSVRKKASRLAPFSKWSKLSSQAEGCDTMRKAAVAAATSRARSSSRSTSPWNSNKRRSRRQKAQMDSNSSFRCKNILAARSVPIVFVFVCFLVIANTRCDQVGSANEAEESGGEHTSYTNSNNGSNKGAVSHKLKLANVAALSTTSSSSSSKGDEFLEQQALTIKNHRQRQQATAATNKLDPLALLREIYLDHDSKIITMLMPESETVQKFHPNGRYGRRSVDNFAEPHTELGKLAYNDDQPTAQAASSGSRESAALRAILRSLQRNAAAPGAVGPARLSSGPTKYAAPSRTAPDSFVSSGAQLASYQLEMNKLLKCNYSGISNLYWCDATGQA